MKKMTDMTRIKIAKYIILLFAVFLTASSANANVLCEWFGYCMYESPGFKIRIVDQESGQPLAGVHAIAAWIQYGAHGTGGPLMALDAMSGPDGELSFPAWGPIRGSSAGIEINMAPGISLFKPGYLPLLINHVSSRDHRARVRGFQRDKETFKMELFKNNQTVWVQELRTAAYPPLMERLSGHETSEIRATYVKRRKLILMEVEKLPQDRKDVFQLRDSLERSLAFIEGGNR